MTHSPVANNRLSSCYPRSVSAYMASRQTGRDVMYKKSSCLARELLAPALQTRSPITLLYFCNTATTKSLVCLWKRGRSRFLTISRVLILLLYSIAVVISQCWSAMLFRSALETLSNAPATGLLTEKKEILFVAYLLITASDVSRVRSLVSNLIKVSKSYF